MATAPTPNLNHARAQPLPLRGLIVAALVTAGVPLAALATAVWLRPTMPDEVATHWDVSGTPDSFGRPLTGSVVAAGVGVVAALLLLLVRKVADPAGRRLLVGILAWLPCLIAAVIVFGLLAQSTALTGDEPAQPGELGWWVLPAGFVVGFTCAVLAAWSLPRAPVVRATGDAPPPPTKPRADPDARLDAPWRRDVSIGAGGWLLALPAAVFVPVAVITWQAGGSLAPVLSTFAFVALIDVLVSGMLFVTVTVDSCGLDVRTRLPLLRRLDSVAQRVPLDRIVSADVTDVRALSQFGGWGYRLGSGGRSGFILRSGDALQVTRADGSVLVVTVDDAHQAAGRINSLLDRVRG